MELLNNAGLGWRDFTDAGKFVALLAASLIFLWASDRKRAQKPLLVYTTVTAVCCVFPLTAAGLMLYQTKFYDYQWIWSLVPMTCVIAYGAVCVLDDCWPAFRVTEWKKGVPVLLLLLMVLTLSSGMGIPAEDETEVQRRTVAESTLKQVQEEMAGEKICLWAPADILEYARETDASVELLYGRNMWDEWLNAYAYDTYSEELVSLYQWMEETAVSGQQTVTGQKETMEQQDRVGQKAAAVSRVEEALQAGANCILLPESMDEGTVKDLERKLPVRVVNISGYYLLIA